MSINGVEAIWCLNKAVGGMAHSKDVLRYIAAANPAVILSLLVERDADNALIAEQAKRIAELEQRHCGGALMEREEHHVGVVNKLLERIAELEARTLTVKLPYSIPCPTAPETIWLQTNGDDSEESRWPTSDDDVSWCRDKIFTNDTLYVRADCAAAGITLVVGE